MTNESLVVLGNNVFANSLIGATIQDGGKRDDRVPRRGKYKKGNDR